MNVAIATPRTRLDIGLSWFLLMATILIAVGGFWLVQGLGRRLVRNPAFDLQLTWAVSNLFFYMWVRVFSGLGKRCQIATAVAVIGSQLIVYATVRVDGFQGDGRLIFASRWAPTHAAQFEKYQAENSGFTSLPVSLTPVPQTDWPGYRRNGSGTCSSTTNLALTNQDPVLLWQHPIAAGWSSFSIVGQHCFTMEQRGETECVVCYELKTGREAWSYSYEARFHEITSGDGPRSTPLFHDGRLYCIGATGVLTCLDASTGQGVWQKELLARPGESVEIFGVSGSTVIVGNLVIVACGTSNSLRAFDISTGESRWVAQDVSSSYTTPFVADFPFGQQLVYLSRTKLSGFDPKTGAQLWSIPWGDENESAVNAAQPELIASDSPGIGLVLIASGYGRGSMLVEIHPQDSGFVVRTRWQNQGLRCKFSSMVQYESCIYGLDDGILCCVDIETGERNVSAHQYHCPDPS